MGIKENISWGLRVKNLYLITKPIQKIKNWHAYYLDFFCLIRKPKLIYHMRNGLKILVRSGTADRGIITSVLLADEYLLDQTKLESNSVVIDIGAQIGVFSIFAASKSKRVYSFEPVPENYRLLLENIKINNFDRKIKAFNYAVSNEKKNLRLFLNENNTGEHSVYFKTKKYLDVPAVPLKDIFDEHNINICDLLKIDTEGSEYEILYGLPKDYFKRIKRIYVEYHDINGVDTSGASTKYNHIELKKYLEKNGYKVTDKNDYLYCIKKLETGDSL